MCEPTAFDAAWMALRVAATKEAIAAAADSPERRAAHPALRYDKRKRKLVTFDPAVERTPR
jgi:hypothetical protein